MPRERGKEWKHVKVLQTSKKNCLVKCNYCDKQFWIGSGNRIRAHLEVENISGVAKCSSVPEEVVVRFMQAEADKISRNAEMSCIIRVFYFLKDTYVC